jgi:WhiB family redox-sensing transcriptional regulator
VSRYDWMEDARCAQVDPELWHPDGKGVGYRDAKQVCAGCPVQQQCADFAQQVEGDLAHSHRHGLWGGQLPRARADAAAGNERRRREAEREERIIRLYRRGGLDAEQIADLVGCTDRTVYRVTARLREQLGEAA